MGDVTYIDVRGNPVAAPRSLKPAAASGAHDRPRARGAAAYTAVPTARWRAAAVGGMLVGLCGLFMVLGARGVAAVVLWPLGTFAMLVGGFLLGAARIARAAAYGAVRVSARPWGWR